MSVADPEVLVYDHELIAEKAYWVDRLAGEFAESFLIPDYPGSRFHVDDTDECELEIAGSLYDRLKRLTGQSPFLLYTTLLAALKVCLFKYSGRRRIAVGSPALMAGGVSETEPNVLVIIDDLEPDASFKTLLAQVRQSLLEASQRQRYPFTKLIEDLKRADTLDRAPFFDCALALAEIHAPLPDLRIDLTLRFSDTGIALKGAARYHRRLFARRTIERFIGHFLTILEGATGDVSLAISRLSPLTKEERGQLLVDWNQTAVTYAGNQFLPHLFEAQVGRSPDAVAVSDGERRLTYRELNEKANRLAHYLQSLGVGPEANVGLFIGRSLEMVVGALGVLKAGGAYVPLDPQSPPDRLSYLLDDAQVRALLTQQKLLASLPPVAVARVLCLDSEEERLAGHEKENPGALIEPENAAYVIYTSGSTGRPKGVVVTHNGLSNYLNWSLGSYPVGEGTMTPLHTPFGFDLTVTSLFPPLISGGRVELVPELPGVEGLLKILSTPSTSSLIKLTPSHLQLLNRQVAAGRIAGRVSALVIGGEALTGEMIEIWQKEFPHTRLINEYGPTETVVGCVVYEVKDGRHIVGPAPIGRPIANTRLYVLDQYGLPVPVGVAGELYIGGKGLARGYWRRADLTAERFVPDPFSSSPGERLYRTGDLVRYLPDGAMEYLGRADTQIKLGGHRIEPGEIEYHLRLHAAVREAAVTVRRDPHAQERLVAYVTPVEGQGEPTTRELREFLLQRLPEYMLPARVVSLPALPLTPHGKTDLRALPEPDWSAYGADGEQLDNPTEELLRGVWREALRVEDVGVEDSFFALGGHSLLATQVVSRVREIWGLDVELLSLFERPTIRALGQWLDEQQRGAPGQAALKRIERVAQAGHAPLSFAQERLWFLDQLDPGSPLYTVQLAIRLHGKLKLDVLERSLNEIVRRHEILRTRFALESDGPAQIVLEPEPIVFRVEDLRGRGSEDSPGDPEAAAREALRVEGLRGFDLRKGRLIR
ncbi:MAG TPA: amino acid adenylation domain-containing protein, partial [Blastocatellia bacterium]|nr:amino acid adenylation domain-containing protein [Blastocatellia bacterium]